MSMYPDLQGKRVMITGSSSGIGLACAERFQAEAAQVVLCGRNPKHMAEAAAAVPACALQLLFDVADPLQVAEAFQEVDDKLGGLDVLICNAGISLRHECTQIRTEDWRKVMGINSDGAFYCAREAALRMQKQGSGVILMTASTNGMEGHPHYADYNASKAALILLAKTMALELAPTVRVNAVSPGYVMTPMQLAEYTEEMLAQVNAGIPLRRHAKTEEVAALFAFLASDQASFITGANIPIDGGETAGKF